MSTNYLPWLVTFISVLNSMFNIATWFYVRRENKDKVTNERFGEHEMRIVQLENDVKHPNCTRHQALEDKIATSNQGFNVRLDALHGDIRELTGSVKGLSRAVDLMNEYLINKKG